MPRPRNRDPEPLLSWLLRGMVRAYQLFVSPLLPPSCRYLPTCSDYAAEALAKEATVLAQSLAEGPTFAHSVTKQCLHREWEMSVDVAIDHEAEQQALCMQTEDFARAYRAFAAKQTPKFEGN